MIKLKIKSPKLDSEQRKTVSKLVIDVGKLFLGGGVVGSFIPGVGDKITIGSFLIALLISLACFTLGVNLAKKEKYKIYEY